MACSFAQLLLLPRALMRKARSLYHIIPTKSVAFQYFVFHCLLQYFYSYTLMLQHEWQL